MITSKNGIALIKKFEGFRSKVYKDIAGKNTIGYGHLILPNENLVSITEFQAEELLKKDLGIAEQAVNRLIVVTINQNQFDALVSFAFNLGVRSLQMSTLRKLLNMSEYKNASKEFLKWCKSKGKVIDGLYKRRVEEMNLFLKE